MMAPTADIYAMSVEELVTEVEELREALWKAEQDLEELRLTMYSEDEQAAAVQAAYDEAEDAIRDEFNSSVGPIGDDAHRLLGEWAWRAVNGDAAAQAAEREAGPLLKRIRDQYAL